MIINFTNQTRGDILKAETIAIGTELLIGQIANTNAQYLSQKLNELGVNVYYHTVVGDNEQRVIDTLRTAVNRSDYIFITGGLGPTEDDLTREAVASFANVELVEDPLAKEKIIQFFTNKNINMPKSNLKQALFPKGATILENDCGTAPGFILNVTAAILLYYQGRQTKCNIFSKLKYCLSFFQRFLLPSVQNM